MKCFLGIDGGGSGSRWALMDAGGRFLGRGDGPPIQVSRMGVRESADVVAKLIGEAGQHPVAAVVAGLAGAGSHRTRREVESALAGPCGPLGTGSRLRVVSDIKGAAAATLAGGPGVAVWSGTGSFAVSCGADGMLHRAGGHGPLLGDEGSAHAVVVAAARAALRSGDRVGPATGMLAGLEEALGVAGMQPLVAAMQARTPAEIAGLFPVVLELAARGDGVARSVLQEGAEQLVGLARAACDQAGLSPAEALVVLGGGALGHRAYAARVVRALVEGGFQNVVGAAPRRPSEGAALLARAWHQGEAPMCSWVH